MGITKRVVALVSGVAIGATLLVGCGSNTNTETANTKESSAGVSTGIDENEDYDNTFKQNEDGSFESGGIHFPLKDKVMIISGSGPNRFTVEPHLSALRHR